jgi:hypothetical protein
VLIGILHGQAQFEWVGTIKVTTENGLIVPSQAVWKGMMVLGGVTFQGEFKVFNSKGRWAFLFGKPLMRAARTTHDFKMDIVKIHTESGAVTLSNQINNEATEHSIALGVSLTLDVKQWGTMSGWKPPPRQVSDSQTGIAAEQIDKHEHTENTVNTQEPEPSEQEEVETTKHRHNNDGGMGDAGSTDGRALQMGVKMTPPLREVLMMVIPIALWTQRGLFFICLVQETLIS